MLPVKTPHGREWRPVWVALVIVGISIVPAPAMPLRRGPEMAVSQWLWRAQASTPVNTASVSLQMTPDKTVGVGGKVSFRVTARKAGYVVLVDVDATGRMTQIFPSPELLAQSGEKDINFVRPGEELQIPPAAARQHGFEYVITPPTGAAAMVVIWSERRVQLLDLPDMPRRLQGPSDALSYLATWTSELRVPDGSSGKLLPSSWSFDIKAYSIQ
ncbi:DUF4384 domain-containing protein [Bradyrhizobium sp. 2TAF24]|uniref:DUF4384 domain-containing protein n=1 Tax=Bradyrhizobium sp. 2TAF24 TaxID=3233011 RepID=UPI003F9214E9